MESWRNIQTKNLELLLLQVQFHTSAITKPRVHGRHCIHTSNSFNGPYPRVSLENGFKNQPMLHHSKKTWHLEIDTRERRFLLETIIFRVKMLVCVFVQILGFQQTYVTNPSWASTCFVWPAVLWTSETDYGVCRAQL